MGLPPPKLRNLSTLMEGNSTAGTKPIEVWEIGVPAKNSLSWSIVLSALLSADEVSFPNILKTLTGNESVVREIAAKKKLSQSKINADEIKQKLHSFNPFKNRHNIFHEKEISEIVRIFSLRLNRYANEIKSRTDKWNDDLKLKAASRLIGFKIEVYFSETGGFKRYSELSRASPNANIILFEYQDQMHGKRTESINIFCFSMGLQQVHNLKLSALRHFLKKAKISQNSIDKIIRLMNVSENHGTAFLPAIMEKGCIDILPEIYKSPYIALKLSEAGFETDPIARISGKPSPLCYALLCRTNSAELRILYDYASNCRCLFDKSLKQVDDTTVLDNLERIKSVVESDISILKSFNFDRCSTERAVHILTQLSRFIEYQFKIVNDVTKLKSKLKSKDIKTSDCRKKIINVIVEHYLNFSRYGNESGNISQQHSDFVRFSEYYDFTDNFFYLFFFDNFFKLKLLFDLQEENVLSSHVEGKMCLAVKSYEYFSTHVPLNTSEDLDSINEKRSENILRHIPLYYRNVVQSELVSLIQILKHSEDSHIKEYLKNGCNSYPEIIDEVLISRLNKYLKAVEEISLETDELTCSQFLVIERAVQVIGESIKPSSGSSIASFLLRSCIPIKLQKAFIRIRNDLSKYRCNSVYGKLKTEKDKKVLEGIKNELKQIQDAFEIVIFTQYSRIEELVMNECLNHLKNNEELNEYDNFKKKYDSHLKERSIDYAKKHKKCIELLLDSLSDLQEQSKEEYTNHDLRMQELFELLKLIKYLLDFTAKKHNQEYLNDLLQEVQSFSKINYIKYDQIEELINKSAKWEGEIRTHKRKKNIPLSVPNIESFLESMKQNFSEDEKIRINALVDKTLKEALHLEPESLDYEKRRKNCIELLLYLFSELLKQSKKGYRIHDTHMEEFFGQLKSIEYLIEFIAKKKNEKYLNDLLEKVQNFCKMGNIKHDQIPILINILSKWEDEILQHNPKKNITLSIPNIESFLESMKQNIFSEDERKQINTLVEKTVEEAINAKCDLEGIFKKGFNKESIPEVNKLLEKIPLPDSKLAEIKSGYEHEPLSPVSLKPLKCLKESIIKDIKKMIEDNSLSDGHPHTVLTKIVFQRKSNSSSPIALPNELYEKLENFLSSKVNILVNRTKILMNILIDDDEEIKVTRKWGRSEPIKHHLKFLMRQRYMRETSVCASLEMAHFDLLNIVHKPLPPCDEKRDTRADPDNYMAMCYEKSKNLFAGYDLRNLLSHRNNIPEVIGEALDKDDFPSEMIEKILKWIDDSDAVGAMLELFKRSGVIEKEAFVNGIKESIFPKQCSDLIRTIKNCDTWEEYIPYFPFVKE